MDLARMLRELWRRKVWLVLSCVASVVVGLALAYHIQLSPPALHPRALQIGAASARVLVDSPRSTVITLTDGLATAANLQPLADRAEIMANLITSGPVLARIGAAAGVPPQAIAAQAPIIANVPRDTTEPGAEQRATDLVVERNPYRLVAQASASLPIISIYAEAPSAAAAERLANGAAQGLRDYVWATGAAEGIPPGHRVVVKQLGSAHGADVTNGINLKVAILAGLATFLVLCVLILVVSGVARQWRAAAAVQRDELPPEPAYPGRLLEPPSNGAVREEPRLTGGPTG